MLASMAAPHVEDFEMLADASMPMSWVQGLAPGGGWGGAPVARLTCGQRAGVRVANGGRRKRLYDLPLPRAFDFKIGGF